MKKGIALLAVLVAVLVLGAATFAVAGTQTVGTGASASGTVNATMTVNPKLTMTITTSEGAADELLVDFGTIDPGTPVDKDVTVEVKSNKAYTITAAPSGDIVTTPGTGWNLTHTPALGSYAKGTQAFADKYSVNPSWSLDPRGYTGQVLYTVTQ